MAQFGTVSGIEDLQTAFRDLASSLGSSQSLQAASMVGRDVLVPGKTAELVEGAPVTGAVELPNSVSSLGIAIYDTTGQLVRRLDMGVQPAGMAQFTWDGLAEDGAVVAPGKYEFRAEAVNGGNNEAFDVMLARRVHSVTLPRGGAELTLELAGLGQVNFSEIRQIR
jgi:flagellar basal-body rod modification protein FlgD